MDLGSLLDPASTAVLTMELQRGVVGDLAALPHLRDAAALVSMPANAGRICASARTAGATVVWDRARTSLPCWCVGMKS